MQGESRENQSLWRQEEDLILSQQWSTATGKYGSMLTGFFWGFFFAAFFKNFFFLVRGISQKLGRGGNIHSFGRSVYNYILLYSYIMRQYYDLILSYNTFLLFYTERRKNLKAYYITTAFYMSCSCCRDEVGDTSLTYVIQNQVFFVTMVANSHH